MVSNLVEAVNSSPYYRLLGMRIEEIRNGYSRVVLDVKPNHLQALGKVHGGVVASIADSAAGLAATSTVLGSGKVTVTVELKVNYLRPVDKGVMVAEGRVIHKGSRIIVVETEVKDDTGLVAKAISTNYIVDLR